MPEIKAEELNDQIGKSQPPSQWSSLEQSRINLFAEATDDYQFIHMDEEKAKETPFGGTIAHGFLSLSMLTHLAEGGAGIVVANAKMGVNYGFDKIRFLMPVRAGKRVRGHFKLVEVTEKKPGQFLLKSEVTVEIEGESKPAIMAEWLTMYMV
ncbi:MAG: Nodulation protein N [Gammaproteobacteria bacterium]|nr:MAG: Nodulation protein N [Gammaproteobacteria bacterium]